MTTDLSKNDSLLSDDEPVFSQEEIENIVNDFFKENPVSKFLDQVDKESTLN